MALTLHKQPAEINFSNDPIELGFTTDALNVSAGTQSVSLITFSSAMSEGEIIVLRWSGTELRYEAKDSPVLSNEIPSGTTDLAVLLPYFVNNHTIQKYFGVDIYAGMLRFTAKEAGTAYDLATGSFDGGTIASSVAGVDPVKRQNFSVWVEVTVDSEVVYEDYIPVNADSKAEVDVHEALHSLLAPDMPSDMAAAEKCTKSVKAFSIRYAEVFGAKPQIQLITAGSSYMVMLGGSSLKNRRKPLQLLGASAAEDPCLRFGSAIRYVYTDQDQYLYFSALRAAGTYYAKVNITYTDDTTHAISSASVVLLKNEKAFFNVGYAALDLGSLPKEVKSYTVTIEAGAVAKSKVYTFVVDYGYHRFRRSFAYQSSLGIIDCFVTYGKQSREMEYFKAQAERVLDETIDDLSQFIDYKIELQESYQVATGFKTKAEIAYMRDFYLSPAKWRINQAWVPIIVSTSKILEAKDAQNLYAHSFEYAYAFRDDGFSESDIDSEIMPSPPPGFLGGGNVEINLSSPAINFDSVPVQDSTRAVYSGGVFFKLSQKEDLLPSGSTTQFFRGDKTLGNLNQEVIAVSDPRYFYNNSYGNTNKILLTSRVDATAASTADPLAGNPGVLDLGTLNAVTVRIGQSTSKTNLFGQNIFESGILSIRDAENTGLEWINGSGVNTYNLKVKDNLFHLKAASDAQGVFFDTSQVYDSEPTTFVWPDESANLTDNEFQGFDPIFRTVATREWVKAQGSPWLLGGNGLIDGDQVIGFGGVTYDEFGDPVETFIGDLIIQLFGSNVAKFTPEGNAMFGNVATAPLAVGHFHANVSGDTEVALFRASNVNVNNYFGVSVDPTINEVFLRNSGTLRVKNLWDFDAVANFSVSPTTVAATSALQIPNWGQVQNIVSAASQGIQYYGRLVKAVFYNDNPAQGGQTSGSYSPASGDVCLFLNAYPNDGTLDGLFEWNGSSWWRPTDADSDAEIRGFKVQITEGTYAGKKFVNTNTSAISFVSPTPVATAAITYVEVDIEADPVFQASPAGGITTTQINNWNQAYSEWNTFSFSAELLSTIGGTDNYFVRREGSSYITSGIFETTAEIETHKKFKSRLGFEMINLDGKGLNFSNPTSSGTFIDVSGNLTIRKKSGQSDYGFSLSGMAAGVIASSGTLSMEAPNLYLIGGLRLYAGETEFGPSYQFGTDTQLIGHEDGKVVWKDLDHTYITDWDALVTNPINTLGNQLGGLWEGINLATTGAIPKVNALGNLVDSNITEEKLNLTGLATNRLLYWDGSSLETTTFFMNSSDIYGGDRRIRMYKDSGGTPEIGVFTSNDIFLSEGAFGVKLNVTPLGSPALTFNGYGVGGAIVPSVSGHGTLSIGTEDYIWSGINTYGHIYANGGISQELLIEDAISVRELQGLFLSGPDDESFFVGTDIETGQGIFRHKYYDQYTNLLIRETTFLPDQDMRLCSYDPSVGRSSIREYMYKDEFEALFNERADQIEIGGGILQGLPSVLAENNNSQIRAQFQGVDYATINEVVSASNKSIFQVLQAGTLADNQEINFKNTNTSSVSGQGVGIAFLNENSSEVSRITYNNNIDTLSISALGANNISIQAGLSLELVSLGDDVLIQAKYGNGEVNVNGHIKTAWDMEVTAAGKGIILKDTGNGNRYRITMHNGQITHTAL